VSDATKARFRNDLTTLELGHVFALRICPCPKMLPPQIQTAFVQENGKT
jgi:hypothetical protein